jgi:hypothetical protein
MSFVAGSHWRIALLESFKRQPIDARAFKTAGTHTLRARLIVFKKAIEN